MNRNLLARCIAVVLLGILFGYYVDYDNRKTRQMDREQYIARETHKFEESKSNPTPAAAMVVGAIMVIGVFVFLYELVVIGVSAVLRATGQVQEKPPGSTGIPFS
jgi:hypothetical protein